MGKMRFEKRIKRLQYRIHGEPDSVPDSDALPDTLIIRHLDRLERLGRDTAKSWVMTALRNQLLRELKDSHEVVDQVMSVQAEPTETKPSGWDAEPHDGLRMM